MFIYTPMRSLSSPLGAQATDSLDTLFNNSLFLHGGNAMFNVTSWDVFSGIVAAVLYGHQFAAHAGPAAGAGGLGAALGDGGVLSGAAGPAVEGFGGAPALAGVGQGSSVGELSVPPAWSAGIPVENGAARLTASGWAVPAADGAQMTTLPVGMPAVAAAGRGGYGIGPRYGVKPKVMPTEVLV